MATVVKTFVFLSNAENLADVGDYAMSFAWYASSGSPANGCVKFTASTFSETEKARTGAGVSWESLFGVPASSTVTAVQVTAWKYGMGYDANWVFENIAPSLKMRVINASNTTVHSAGELVSMAPTADPWASGAAGTSRAVDASYQDSTTAVKFEIEFQNGKYSWDDGEGGSGFLGYDIYLDTIEITVTYTPAVAAGNPFYYYRSQ